MNSKEKNTRLFKNKKNNHSLFENYFFDESILNFNPEIKKQKNLINKKLINFEYDNSLEIFVDKNKIQEVEIKQNNNLIITESNILIKEINKLLENKKHNVKYLNNIDFSSHKFDELIKEIKNIDFLDPQIEEEEEQTIKEIILK